MQAGQTSLCYDADFYPFGGERDITTTCGSNYKFEGKERDTETGDDDFGARYYTSRLGRWLSADWSSVPAPVPYANLTNPQTLNLYAMVSDNPETFADLDGHQCGPTMPGTLSQCKGNTTTPTARGDGPSQKNGTTTSTTQAAQGAAISAGASLTNDAAARASYAAQASELSGPNASAARTALQQSTYQKLSPVGQAITDTLKQSRGGQLAGKTAAELVESASRTNEAVNAAGNAARVAGPACSGCWDINLPYRFGFTRAKRESCGRGGRCMGGSFNWRCFRCQSWSRCRFFLWTWAGHRNRSGSRSLDRWRSGRGRRQQNW